jgi:hypothetical protein
VSAISAQFSHQSTVLESSIPMMREAEAASRFGFAMLLTWRCSVPDLAAGRWSQAVGLSNAMIALTIPLGVALSNLAGGCWRQAVGP